MFSKIMPWVIASRVKTLPAAVCPVLIGTALAFNQKEQINFLIFFFNTLCINTNTTRNKFF